MKKVAGFGLEAWLEGDSLTVVDQDTMEAIVTVDGVGRRVKNQFTGRKFGAKATGPMATIIECCAHLHDSAQAA